MIKVPGTVTTPLLDIPERLWLVVIVETLGAWVDQEDQEDVMIVLNCPLMISAIHLNVMEILVEK